MGFRVIAGCEGLYARRVSRGAMLLRGAEDPAKKTYLDLYVSSIYVWKRLAFMRDKIHCISWFRREGWGMFRRDAEVLNT